MVAGTPPDQAARLEALRRYEILDTPREPAYDDIVRLAAHICATPVSVVNFIDEDRQWFKSEIGLGVRETPLDISICSHAILQQDMFVVPDTLLDPRFRHNPLCSSHPGIRFYAGALLRTAEGLPLGTLCVLDYVPRQLSSAQEEALRALSRQVMTQLELHHSLKAMRESDQLARSLIESSPDCVKVLDLEGRLLTMNSAGMRQLRIADVQRYCGADWTAFWEGKDRDAAKAAIQEARSGGIGQFEGYCPATTGEPRWWEVIVTPILDSAGQPSNLLCVSREISERRRTEEQLRQTAKLESLGVMAGGIAHDFNNLLTGILGNASLLMESVTNNERGMAESIVNAAERAADLTRQMLAYSGKGQFESKRINLSAEVREILRLVQPSFEKTVQVVLELDDNLPLIDADPSQIQQLIMNLTINAAEALERRPGRLTIATQALYAANGPSVLLMVSDTGIGMSEETKSRIFDPFFSTKFTGRGLGLAAVSGIVRGHRGTMEVQTGLGAGTAFRVVLPAVVAERLDQDPEPKWNALRGRGTILLVDDEDMVRRVGKASLEHSGYDVLLADDGRHAIEVFAQAALEISRVDISLVVLDMMMPIMNGEDTLARLQDIRPDVPVIVSSGYDESEVTRRFTSGNIAGFIQKPYSASQLAGKVKEVLANRDSMKASASGLN